MRNMWIKKRKMQVSKARLQSDTPAGAQMRSFRGSATMQGIKILHCVTCTYFAHECHQKDIRYVWFKQTLLYWREIQFKYIPIYIYINLLVYSSTNVCVFLNCRNMRIYFIITVLQIYQVRTTGLSCPVLAWSGRWWWGKGEATIG